MLGEEKENSTAFVREERDFSGMPLYNGVFSMVQVRHVRYYSLQ
jgi:hypothetical protein